MRTVLFNLVVVVLLATACGSDSEGIVAGQPDGDAIPVEGDGGIGDGAGPIPTTALPDGPIPVEPDGGIGDGASPLPGTEDDAPAGDWHGAAVATTNCPGTSFVRVDASAFSFSVPDWMTDDAVQGIDSEVAQWSNDDGSIVMSYDYGWYSGSPEGHADATDTTPLDYSGVTGVKVGAERWVAVYFGEVEVFDSDPQVANALLLTVTFDDPADRIFGECIVGSVEWR